MAACPSFENGVLTPLNCFGGCGAYDFIIDEDGSFSGVSTSADLLGYDSSPRLGRICIPSLAVLEDAFETASTVLSSALQQNDIAEFITDMENVTDM